MLVLPNQLDTTNAYIQVLAFGAETLESYCYPSVLGVSLAEFHGALFSWIKLM